MLIVEDGTSVPNANTYISLADFKTKSAQYSSDIAQFELTDAQLEQIILRATLFVDNIKFKGQQVDPMHERAWPRVDVCFAPFTLWPENKVPPQLVNAVVLLGTGVILEGDEVLTPPQNVRREKVGQLEAEFYSNGGVGTESVWQQQALSGLYPFTRMMGSLRV